MAARSRKPRRFPLAVAAAAAVTLGLQEKRCQNVYMEPDETDPTRQLVLIETPGSLAKYSFGEAGRGLAQADGHAGGKILVPHGSTLATYNPTDSSVGALTGTLPGTDPWDIAFTQNEALILVDGKLKVSDGTTIRSVTDGVKTAPTLAIGSTVQNVAHAAFGYSINDTAYSKGASVAGEIPGTDVIPIGTYGCVAFDIDAAGTVYPISAPGNATGYASSTLAISALPDPVYPRIRFGAVTVTKSDGAFTFGTTALNAANVTTTYADGQINTVFEDLLSDAGVTKFTSVAQIGQRGLFTYGPRFGFTAVDDLATATALNYYTAENQPDDLVAVRVMGQDIFLFGTDTIEIWAQQSNADDPFALQSGRVIKTGCLCRDGIQITDNSIIWIADDHSVRRLAGGDTAAFISEPWITRKLQVEPIANIGSGTQQVEGHTFYYVRTPNGCYWWDALASSIAQQNIWHTRVTNLTSTWRWRYIVEYNGTHYVIDDTGVFDLLSRDYNDEHMPAADTEGTRIVRQFTAVGNFNHYETIPAMMLVAAKGIGTATGQGANPLIGMQISTDGGQTFSAIDYCELGAQGNYAEPSIWRMNGSAERRGAVFLFTKSDPAPAAYKTLEEVVEMAMAA